MRLIKPSWIQMDSKSDYPIYCVDISPDCTTLAMGGQGESSGRIKLFKISLKDEASEENLICQLDNVTKCVNCLRWSHSGKFLASGDDQHHLKIWRASKTTKCWQMHKMMVGHRGDVLDLSWSSSDRFLATASVDNTVIVWDALHWSGQIQTLRGHKGFVKGVDWDPLGHFLASQCDRSVRIWRTSTWEQVASVKKPFRDCHSSTHALRLRWLAEGQRILSAHAMNNNTPTAQFIDRDTWATPCDLVGHRKAVSAVATNPFMFAREGCADLSYFAVGGRDRSISFWQTGLARPLFVVHDLFANSVSDIAWNPSGYQFVCSSIDGTLAFFTFDHSELGDKQPQPHSIERDLPVCPPSAKCPAPLAPPTAQNGRRRIPLTFLGSFDSDEEIVPSKRPSPPLDPVQPPLPRAPSPPLTASLTRTPSHALHVANDNPRDEHYLCTLTDSEGTMLWQSFAPSPCVSAGISKSITAVLCDDSSLHVFLTPSGNLVCSLLLPLETRSVFCAGDVVLVEHSRQFFTSWDMRRGVCLVAEGRLPRDVTAGPGVRILRVRLVGGDISLALSNGRSYLYVMSSWLPVEAEVVPLQNGVSTGDPPVPHPDQITTFRAEVAFLRALATFSVTNFLHAWRTLLSMLSREGDERRLRGLISSLSRQEYLYSLNLAGLDPIEVMADSLGILDSNPKLSFLRDCFVTALM